MENWLRTHPWYFGLCGLGLALLVAGVIAVRQPPTEAAEMPAAHQAFWSWVSEIPADPAAAVEPGVTLLQEHPDLRLLYLRLAEVCLEAGAGDGCQKALAQIAPPDSLTERYRRAALARLATATEHDASGRYWKPLAADALLDPALARLVVDQGKKRGQEPWLEAIEAQWQHQFDGGDPAVGAVFGLGYLAALRGDWDTAEAMLGHVTEALPDDPHAYREFGRIYFFTEQSERFVAVLDEAIRAARSQHDLAQELILQGNLGWELVRRNRDLDRAERLLSDALRQSRALADEETAGFNYYRLAVTYTLQHRYLEALALLDSADVRYARHASHRQAEVWHYRGATLKRMARFAEGEAELERAIAEAKRLNIIEVQVRSLNELAMLHFNRGQVAAARIAGLEALQLARQARLYTEEQIARRWLAAIERQDGRYEVALEQYRRALIGAREAGNVPEIRRLYFEMGETALDMRDTPVAEAYFRAMVDSTALRQEPAALAQAYRGMGETFAQYGTIPEALRYFDLALERLPAAPEATAERRLRATILIEKARAMLRQPAPEEADALLHEAARLAPDYRPVKYSAAEALAVAALRRGRYQDALRHTAEAEAIDARAPRPSAHWHVLYLKALALWRLDRMQEAEAAFRGAVGVLETLRESLASSTSRAHFVQDKVHVYEAFAALLDEQGRTAEALHYTERARSRSLVDLLYTTQLERNVDLRRPADRLLEMDRRAQVLADALDAAPDEDAAEPYHRTRLSQLRREHRRADSLYREARLQLSPNRQLYAFNPLSTDSLRRGLGSGEALLLYDLREAIPEAGLAASAVVYVVLPETVQTFPLAVDPALLVETIRAFRTHLGTAEQGPGEGWEPWARRLHTDLVAPALGALPDGVTHLHLVPEGVLHYLPFAALLDAQGRFLAERYTLSVAPSASTLSLSRAANPRQWGSMLLLGDPNGVLPGARREVRDIAAAGPARHAHVGADAVQAVVEEHAGNYDVLHFATHGRFVPNAPWRSHLELHDGEQLTVEEIGRLDLNAYLVTLSACESALSGGGVSDVPTGDEWVGLSQAFLAAGTSAVMATLWPIDDRVSSDFMVGFYAALSPEGKARALARVQRQFIRDSHTAHPFYWAPFIVMGDPL